MEKYDKVAFDFVRNHYQNDYGRPFEMTFGQIKIFRAIYERKDPRNQVETYTQYGKSDVISMAVLSRVATWAEKWPIVGGTTKKAKIIMGYVIKHIFENSYTRSKFQIGKDESLERIKRERSKERITLKVGDNQQGEIFVLSAEARRKGEDAGDTLIGFGAPNLIEDDSPLIPDRIHGKAMRMLLGHKDNFLVKVGNTFNRNHFFKSHNNPKYKKITVDCYQGVEEGRITQEQIDEMRDDIRDPILFGILLECKFPPAEAIDIGGWLALLLDNDIEEAKKRKVEVQGIKSLGVDVGEGGSFNVWTIRTDNHAFVKEKNKDPNLMNTANRTLEIMEEERILAENTFVDAIGSGAGVASRIKEQGREINDIKVGEKAQNERDYYNIKAEAYDALKKWIRGGAALEPHEDWDQLTKIKWKEVADRKSFIMPKEEMRRRGIESPDVAESLMLTFCPKKEIEKIYQTEATPPLLPYYPSLGY